MTYDDSSSDPKGKADIFDTETQNSTPDTHNTHIAQYREKYRKVIESLNSFGADREIKIEILPGEDKEAVEIVLGAKSIELVVRWSSETPLNEVRFKQLFASRLAGILYNRVNQPEFKSETHITKAFKRVFSSYNLWLPITFMNLKNVEWYEESRMRARNVAFLGVSPSVNVKWAHTHISAFLAQYIISAAMSEIMGRPCYLTLNGFPFFLHQYPSRHIICLNSSSSSKNVLILKPSIISKYLFLEAGFGRTIYCCEKLIEAYNTNHLFKATILAVCNGFYGSVQDGRSVIFMNNSALSKMLKVDDHFLYPVSLVGVYSDMLVGVRLKQLWEISFHTILKNLGLDAEILGFLLTTIIEHFINLFPEEKQSESSVLKNLKPVEKAELFHFFAFSEGVFDAIYAFKTGSSAKSMFALPYVDKFKVFKDKLSWVLDTLRE